MAAIFVAELVIFTFPAGDIIGKFLYSSYSSKSNTKITLGQISDWIIAEDTEAILKTIEIVTNKGRGIETL